MVFRVGQPSADSAAGPGTRDQPILAKRVVEGLLGSLQGRLTPTQARALSSLAHEGDTELFGESLLDVARRVQRSDNPEAAALIYRWFESEECPSLPQVQARARRELDAIEGRGEGGARAEFLIGRFFQEASNPASIFAMGAAGALFRVTRLASLARLTAGSEGGLFTGGFGARAASSLLASWASVRQRKHRLESFPIEMTHARHGRACPGHLDKMSTAVPS